MTFKLISNEIPILLLILCWYFSCRQMYFGKFLKIYFHEQMFFKSLWQGRHMSGISRNHSLWIVQVSLINLQVSWTAWFQYFNSKIVFRGTRTDLNNKREFSSHKFFLNFTWINSPISVCYFFIFLVYETYNHLCGWWFPCYSLST